MKSFSKYVLAASLLGAGAANASVWQDTETWSPAWEQKYSDWVNTAFNEDVFTTGKYSGIPTDCADAVYIARIMFAYENKLPFVIKDSTGGDGKVSNKMSRFDGTSDPTARVKKFMTYVGDMVSTKTLGNDTYPVTVSRQYIRPGTVWSRPRITKDNIFSRIFGMTVKEDPGHAEMVKDVSDTGAVYLIGSTVPKQVRKLNTTSSLVFMPVETTTGFRNWIQPQQYSQAKESLPGYSLEQFTSVGDPPQNVMNNIEGTRNNTNTTRNITTWTQDVQRRLALRSEGKGENIERQIANVCSLVNARVEIIHQSEAARAKLHGSCMSAGDYDSYSTPSRDKRIVTTLKQVIDSAGGFGLTYSQRMKALKPYFDKCAPIQYNPGMSISLYDYAQKALGGDVSSNPNESFEARWGLASATSKCPQYE